MKAPFADVPTAAGDKAGLANSPNIRGARGHGDMPPAASCDSAGSLVAAILKGTLGPKQQQQQQQQHCASGPNLHAEALSLVDDNWAFDAAGAAKVLSQTGAGDFLVVGALGTQGAGKSTLLNALLYNMPMGGSVADAAAAAAATAMPPFSTLAAPAALQCSPAGGPGPVHGSRTGGMVQRGRAPGGLSHGTSRLELRVNPTDRTILLDSPPLWSASWVSELASKLELDMGRGAALAAGSGATIMSRAISDARAHGLTHLPAEGVSELLGLQIGALMMAACHVVVLMVDAVDEPRVWEYLQVIDLVAHSLVVTPNEGSAPAAAVSGAISGGCPGGATSTSGTGGFWSGGSGSAGAPAAIHAGLPAGDGKRRVAELVVVLTGLDDDELTIRHLRPQSEMLKLALASTRLLSAARGPGDAGPHVDILRHLEGGGDGNGSAAYGVPAGPPADASSYVGGTEAAAADSGGGGGPCTDGSPGTSGTSLGLCAEESPPPRDSTNTGDVKSCDGSGDHRSGAEPQQQQRQQRRGRGRRTDREPGGSPKGRGDRNYSVGDGRGLHFWALPRARQSPQHRHPQQHQQRNNAPTCDLPPSLPLLAPLCAALLAMPRRPLALGASAVRQPGRGTTGAVVGTDSGGGGGGGGISGPAVGAAAAVHAQPPSGPASVPLLSEREWLRAVQRLWESELQQSPLLERYYLARQRTVFMGAAGWALASR